MTPIAPHITAYLRERLPNERRASPHTSDTYAYAFQLLFEFASQRLGCSPAALQLEQLDAPLVLAFLEHLQTDRSNSPSTRNARLAAIKSFMRFLEHRVPSALEQLRRVLSIPFQKTDIHLVRHLTQAEMQAILDAPEPSIRGGVRDRAMLHLAFTAGLRVSELVGLRVGDATFRAGYVDIRVMGKGRKERVLTLWKVVAGSLRAWLAIRGEASVPELFLNARAQSLTRSGFKHILNKHVPMASQKCPSLRAKRVSPHVLRHTCALNTLRATGDIRKVALWLGHESIQTTEAYLRADPSEKHEMLEVVVPPTLKRGSFRPADKLIASLRGK
ncbi:MAG: tyrosine-type recombinase/integrase [Acidobacteriota bacterium]